MRAGTHDCIGKRTGQGRRRGSDHSVPTLKLHSEKGVSEDGHFESNSLSDAGLSALGDGFPRLEKLSLIWCSTVSSLGLMSLAYKCSFLMSLDLQGCYVGDRGLAAVGKCCKQLEDLNLRFCEGVTDTGLVELAQGCGKSLKSLGVAACAKITHISLEAVSSYCKSLETLSLDSECMHNGGILSVARGCPSLKVLRLQCINVTDDALIAVGTHCLSLELLALNSFQRFTDKRLTELALLYCQRIGNHALLEIGKGWWGMRLIAIGQGCSLQHLNVSGCHLIGDAGIIAIARGCPVLSYLDVSVLQNLGDMAMAELGEGCPLLKEIVLSHCRQITDVGLAHLVKNCTMLESCHVVYCPGITAAGVATVVSSCANIKKVLVEKWKSPPPPQCVVEKLPKVCGWKCASNVRWD
ncbi:hypothetical protein GH714_002762 [Hevea brasiliensis]|uniref:F-box/LRR-repeat protein 15-like leucin rich repeat domain-containing protein n=1 Tax=Hevea brasiliensis TaxID=3981 RepID=A0A6A6KIP7_HEVBR|nr:hypothetical protein GH714_002762 [Hevea brasiliensis]